MRGHRRFMFGLESREQMAMDEESYVLVLKIQ